MADIWNYEKLELLIKNQVEESLNLDYKAAPALQKEGKYPSEITKDISALANSDGGILIYGIREHATPDKAHFPECFDPLSRLAISKEWLEQIAQSIRPKIDGLIIHPVPVPDQPDFVIYVVEVPQSSTAHQARDFRYYKRFNFESVPMQDYEIRDVMSRRQYANIDVFFHILYVTEYHTESGFAGMSGARKPFDYAYLCAIAKNVGRKVAHNLTAMLFLPRVILSDNYESPDQICQFDNKDYFQYEKKNHVRDVQGHGIYAKYGEARYEPILPELTFQLASWKLMPVNFRDQRDAGAKLLWQVYVDDAPKRNGEVLLNDLEIVDKRKTHI